MDKSQEHAELVDRYLTGMADEAEVARLDALLKVDEALRKTFLAASRLDSFVREQAEAGETEEPSRARTFRFAWLPPGATAGLLIGLLSASMAWAYAIPRGAANTRTSQEVVSESFEDAEIKLSGRFPFKANQWFGNVISVSTDGTMPAVGGVRVGKLTPVAGKRSTFVRYIVDLSEFPELAEGHARSLEVTASFHAPPSEQAPGFRVELATFSQKPRAVQAVWNDRENFDDRVLQEVKRNYIPRLPQRADWHEVNAALEVPPGSRSVVISLGVSRLNPNKPISDFYLDAIQVQLVDDQESASR